MIEIINKDFRDCEIPKGLTITDPPYNQGYSYNQYKDRMSEGDYIELLSKIPMPCVIIHYPEETINILPKAFKEKWDDCYGPGIVIYMVGLAIFITIFFAYIFDAIKTTFFPKLYLIEEFIKLI